MVTICGEGNTHCWDKNAEYTAVIVKSQYSFFEFIGCNYLKLVCGTSKGFFFFLDLLFYVY